MNIFRQMCAAVKLYFVLVGSQGVGDLIPGWHKIVIDDISLFDILWIFRKNINGCAVSVGGGGLCTLKEHVLFYTEPKY